MEMESRMPRGGQALGEGGKASLCFLGRRLEFEKTRKF